MSEEKTPYGNAEVEEKRDGRGAKDEGMNKSKILTWFCQKCEAEKISEHCRHPLASCPMLLELSAMLEQFADSAPDTVKVLENITLKINQAWKIEVKK